MAAARFVPAILQAQDIRRSIGGLMGLRPFTVFVRTRRWSGNRVGQGTFVDNAGGPDVQLTNGVAPLGPQPVRVRTLSNRDIIASGGIYRDRDMRVGPLTPSFAASILPAGGFNDSTVDPPQVGSIPTQIMWIVFGPGMFASGSLCDRISLDETALHISLVLRSTGRQA